MDVKNNRLLKVIPDSSVILVRERVFGRKIKDEQRTGEYLIGLIHVSENVDHFKEILFFYKKIQKIVLLIGIPEIYDQGVFLVSSYNVTEKTLSLNQEYCSLHQKYIEFVNIPSGF